MEHKIIVSLESFLKAHNAFRMEGKNIDSLPNDSIHTKSQIRELKILRNRYAKRMATLMAFQVKAVEEQRKFINAIIAERDGGKGNG